MNKCNKIILILCSTAIDELMSEFKCQRTKSLVVKNVCSYILIKRGSSSHANRSVNNAGVELNSIRHKLIEQ